MPSLDSQSGCFVLRIVYDGASEAGKTTSVQALAEALGVEAQASQESRGRTLFFDWLEYRGGWFRDRALRCQVVSVPGQRALLKRRERLLRDADAVVFVVDSSPAGCLAAVEPVTELRGRLAAMTPPASFLVQANKRDNPVALPLDVMRERLGLPEETAITTTVANRGEGVRETFVFTVRLALERLATLIDQQQLQETNPSEEDPSRLLTELQSIELTPMLDLEVPQDANRQTSKGPLLPDELIPLGHIWPAIDGRRLLLEARQETARFEPDVDGAWQAKSAHWLYHSAPEAVFRSLAEGRQHLREWASWHARHDSLLSSGRALALAPDDRENAWRLWQILKLHTPLDVELEHAADAQQNERVDELLEAAAQWAMAAHASPEASALWSRAQLGDLARIDGGARFAATVAAAEGGSIDLGSRAMDEKSSRLIRQLRRLAQQHRRSVPA